jgi:hypothetical protein
MRHIEVFSGQMMDRDARRRVHARWRAITAVILAAAVNTACYSYVPVSFSSVPAKEDVRLRVTEDAAVRLVKEVGAFSTELDGQLTPEGRDSISLGVTIDRTYRGATIGTATQTLVLARSEILEVRRREFSKSRTVALTVGTLVGFGALAAGIAQLVDPNGAPEGEVIQPPPPNSRRPSGFQFRLHIPVP